MKRYSIIIAILIISAVFFNCKDTEDTPSEGFKILNFIGTVTIKTADTTQAPIIGDILDEGDTIETGSDSFCDIVYTDSYLVRITQNSEIIINSILSRVKNSTELELKEGKLLATVAKLQKGNEFTVRTATQTASVRGTTFGVSADDDTTKTEVLQGKVLVNPVVEGEVVKDVEEAVEENSEVELSKEEARKAKKNRKIGKRRLRERRLKKIRDEIAGVNPEVVDSLNRELRREIRIGVLKMKKERFEANEKSRKARLEKLRKKLKKRRTKILERRKHRRNIRKEKLKNPKARRKVLGKDGKEARKDGIEKLKERRGALKDTIKTAKEKRAEKLRNKRDALKNRRESLQKKRANTREKRADALKQRGTARKKARQSR